MMLVIILLFISLIVLSINIILLASFPIFTQKPVISTNYLNMSIVITMKNEMRNLVNLFSSLETQNYPQDNFEAILIDDDSTDNSYQKAVELAQGKNNFRVTKADNKKFPGKKGALDFGISNAKYPYIVITDADCMPAQNWLAGYSEKFTENFDFLFGIAPFVQTKGIINKITCFENLRSSILTFSFAKLKSPYSAAARNMGFKKSSFEKIGGFNNTMQTISGDDDLLIREAVKQNMKIGIVSVANSFVLSNSKTTLSEYLNQKSRHTKTSLHYLPIHKLLLGFWHLSNILILFSLILLPINFFFGLPFFIKICGDMIVILSSKRKLKYNFKLYEIPLSQLIYELFLIVNFFNSLRKTIPWKG
jgi:poly-beta-1,6-N-acetyl-D-glucosamine synthase